MRVLSLFDGKSSAFTALELLNMDIDKYYSAEINPFAIRVSEAIHPQQIRLGDVNDWRDWEIDWGSIDLVIGGFPCQAWSIAGKQMGDRDPRGALFWVMLDIIAHVQKHNSHVLYLIENVKMKKEFEQYITQHTSKALGDTNKVLINSALVSAQHRQRYYWANFDFGQPEDLQIGWGEVREHGQNAFYYTNKTLRWLAQYSQRKKKPLSVWGHYDKATCLTASHYKKASHERFFGICDFPENESVVASMRGRRINPDTLRRDDYNKDIDIEQYIEFRYDDKTNCLSTISKDNIVVPFTLPGRIPANEFFFRYITPRECFRLQTVPESLIDKIMNCGVSNSQLYRIAGNGFTDEVIKHILSHI